MKLYSSISANILAFFMLMSVVCSAQSKEDKATNDKIHWMTFTDAYQKSLKDSLKKKVFIDVYTQWCGWCKRMDASTFEDPEVASYINAHFYPVRLDAETRDTIHFGDVAFVYRPEFKANEIALSLLNQKMSFPTDVYLDEHFNMISPVPGYRTSEQLMPLLRFFAENVYQSMSWDDYEKIERH